MPVISALQFQVQDQPVLHKTIHKSQTQTQKKLLVGQADLDFEENEWIVRSASAWSFICPCAQSSSSRTQLIC